MKSLKSRWTEKGLKTLLVLVAVLGLVSLIGCSNTSGGNASSNGGNIANNVFLGRWTYTYPNNLGVSQTFEFKADGILSITTKANGITSSVLTYEYTVSGNTATMYMTGVSSNAGGLPITLRPDGKSFLYGGNQYTKEN